MTAESATADFLALQDEATRWRQTFFRESRQLTPEESACLTTEIFDHLRQVILERITDDGWDLARAIDTFCLDKERYRFRVAVSAKTARPSDFFVFSKSPLEYAPAEVTRYALEAVIRFATLWHAARLFLMKESLEVVDYLMTDYPHHMRVVGRALRIMQDLDLYWNLGRLADALGLTNLTEEAKAVRRILLEIGTDHQAKRLAMRTVTLRLARELVYRLPCVDVRLTTRASGSLVHERDVWTHFHGEDGAQLYNWEAGRLGLFSFVVIPDPERDRTTIVP